MLMHILCAIAAMIPAQSPAPKPPPYNVPAGDRVEEKPSGFFHAKQIDGRWWLIDPQGRLFYAVGTDHINYNGLPCEKLGYAPYNREVQARYGSEEKWAEATAERLAAWGFNLLPWGHSPSLRYRRFAHTETLTMGSTFARTDSLCDQVHWTGFPNVFSPQWPEHCDRIAARLCAPNRDDPWLLGYFLDNELEWFGKNYRPWGLFDEAWKRPAAHTAKQAWIAFLREELKDPALMQRYWEVRVASFDDLAGHTAPTVPLTAEAREIAGRWVRRVAEKYFEGCVSAIRRHDPNHMVIGCRFAGQAPGVWDVAGRYCDVVSVNQYAFIDILRGVPNSVMEALASWHAQCGKPLLMTEWSFPAIDSGLPCTHGAGMRVDTQAQRAMCFRHFQGMLFSLPFMVGSNYFMWLDEPELGISSGFPENSNYGLVNGKDEPYRELTEAATQLNALVYTVHRTAALPKSPEGGWLVPWMRNPPEMAVLAPQGSITESAGDLTLEGPQEGHAWRISSRDKGLGTFRPVLHQATEPPGWVGTQTAKITALRRSGKVTVVEMEFTGGQEAKRYSCGWRFWIPAAVPKSAPPGAGWFASQCLWVENTDDQPWFLESVYHYLLPTIGGESAGDEPLVIGVPQYYRRGGAWIDKQAGLGIGAWFTLDADFGFNYWKDEAGGLHPDLYEPVRRELRPRQRLTIPGRPAFFFPLRDPSRFGFAAATWQVERAVLLPP